MTKTNEDETAQNPNSKTSSKKEKNGQEELSEVHSQPLTENLPPIIFMVIMFIISISFSIVLAPVFISLNLQADFSELGGEESLWIPFFYLAVILIFTAVILFITRRRRGRFIKYGFLMVIAISLGYVFYAIFSALFFPIPDQEWSGEVELDHATNVIITADLLGDGGQEIITGTMDGKVYIHDTDLNQIWESSGAIQGPVSGLSVLDLNKNGEPELVVLAQNVHIFESQVTGDTYNFNSIWESEPLDPGMKFELLASTKRIANANLTNLVENIFVVSDNELTQMSTIHSIIYSNNTYQLELLKDIDSTIYALVYGNYNGFKYNLYFSTNEGVYSIDLDDMNLTITQELTSSQVESTVIGLSIENFDYDLSNELVAWNDDGNIFIFRNNDQVKKLDDLEGKQISGITAVDFIDWIGDDELVVSSEGRVYVFYDSDKFLDSYYEFTEETGRLDKSATGLTYGYIDDNSDPDLVVGHSDGFKLYQYQPAEYSDIPYFMGLIVAVLLSVALFKYPEWYLVDVVGIFVAAGVTALLGVSIGLLPLIILLIIFAVYDAISVYKTKHMVSLADKVMEFKLPILLVVPKKRGYSFIQQKGLKKQLEDGEEREAMFIGLGDIIIPGTLVISSFTFLPVETGMLGLGTNLLVAIFTLMGVLCGFSALMHFVLKGNPQAGLPLLNTGAILGFVISYILIYQDFTFGMSWPFG